MSTDTKRADTPRDRWVPDWLRGVGMPAWLVAPDGVLTYMNALAEQALGLSADECLGSPCWEAIRGIGDSGSALCRPDCPLRERAARGETLKPFMIRRAGEAHDWLLIQPVRLEAPDGSSPHLVHLATSMRRARRLQAYLEAALTTGARRPAPQVRPRDVLSPREAEVLEHLARNVDQKQIASRLSVSYVTIRHHVQNILRKLDVHSIQEAVALELLSE